MNHISITQIFSISVLIDLISLKSRLLSLLFLGLLISDLWRKLKILNFLFRVLGLGLLWKCREYFHIVFPKIRMRYSVKVLELLNHVYYSDMCTVQRLIIKLYTRGRLELLVLKFYHEKWKTKGIWSKKWQKLNLTEVVLRS